MESEEEKEMMSSKEEAKEQRHGTMTSFLQES
jgi:hypothetical protein